MTRLRIDPPASLRAPLGALDARWSGLVGVVHVGRSAVLLRADATGGEGPGGDGPGGDGALLPVTSAARGLVPGGVCVTDPAEFARFREGAQVAAAARSRPLDLDGWATALRAAPRTDLSVRAGPVHPEAADLLARCSGGPVGSAARPPTGRRSASATAAHPMDPGPLRARAAPLVRAALAGDREGVRRQLDELVGAGPGSTPGGDDVVVGVLAGLDRLAARDRLAGSGPGGARAAGLLRACVRPLLDRTTAVSRHDLTAALGGQVAERVHLLLAALTRPGLVPAAVRAAETWGATSGLDLAAGVAAGARADVRAGSRPDPDAVAPVGRTA